MGCIARSYLVGVLSPQTERGDRSSWFGSFERSFRDGRDEMIF